MPTQPSDAHTKARDVIQGPRRRRVQGVLIRSFCPKTRTLPELPAEADSEFADYHKGALAFHAEDFTRPRKPRGRRCSKRPEAEPVENTASTWAAYMLGKVALQEPRTPRMR